MCGSTLSSSSSRMKTGTTGTAAADMHFAAARPGGAAPGRGRRWGGAAVAGRPRGVATEERGGDQIGESRGTAAAEAGRGDTAEGERGGTAAPEEHAGAAAEYRRAAAAGHEGGGGAAGRRGAAAAHNGMAEAGATGGPVGLCNLGDDTVVEWRESRRKSTSSGAVRTMVGLCPLIYGEGTTAGPFCSSTSSSISRSSVLPASLWSTCSADVRGAAAAAPTLLGEPVDLSIVARSEEVCLPSISGSSRGTTSHFLCQSSAVNSRPAKNDVAADQLGEADETGGAAAWKQTAAWAAAQVPQLWRAGPSTAAAPSSSHGYKGVAAAAAEKPQQQHNREQQTQSCEQQERTPEQQQQSGREMSVCMMSTELLRSTNAVDLRGAAIGEEGTAAAESQETIRPERSEEQACRHVSKVATNSNDSYEGKFCVQPLPLLAAQTARIPLPELHAAAASPPPFAALPVLCAVATQVKQPPDSSSSSPAAAAATVQHPLKALTLQQPSLIVQQEALLLLQGSLVGCPLRDDQGQQQKVNPGQQSVAVREKQPQQPESESAFCRAPQVLQLKAFTQSAALLQRKMQVQQEETLILTTAKKQQQQRRDASSTATSRECNIRLTRKKERLMGEREVWIGEAATASVVSSAAATGVRQKLLQQLYAAACSPHNTWMSPTAMTACGGKPLSIAEAAAAAASGTTAECSFPLLACQQLPDPSAAQRQWLQAGRRLSTFGKQEQQQQAREQQQEQTSVRLQRVQQQQQRDAADTRQPQEQQQQTRTVQQKEQHRDKADISHRQARQWQQQHHHQGSPMETDKEQQRAAAQHKEGLELQERKRNASMQQQQQHMWMLLDQQGQQRERMQQEQQFLEAMCHQQRGPPNQPQQHLRCLQQREKQNSLLQQQQQCAAGVMFVQPQHEEEMVLSGFAEEAGRKEQESAQQQLQAKRQEHEWEKRTPPRLVVPQRQQETLRESRYQQHQRQQQQQQQGQVQQQIESCPAGVDWERDRFNAPQFTSGAARLTAEAAAKAARGGRAAAAGSGTAATGKSGTAAGGRGTAARGAAAPAGPAARGAGGRRGRRGAGGRGTGGGRDRSEGSPMDGSACFSEGVHRIKDINDHYVIGRKLGSGYTASVYEARCLATNRVVAIKHVEKQRQKLIASEGYYRAVYERLAQLPRCQHLLLPPVALLETQTHFYIVMERCWGTDMVDYVLRHPPAGIDATACRNLLQQLLVAVHILHSNRVLHRDIKLDNIMFRESCMSNRTKVEGQERRTATAKEGDMSTAAGEEVRSVAAAAGEKVGSVGTAAEGRRQACTAEGSVSTSNLSTWASTPNRASPAGAIPLAAPAAVKDTSFRSLLGSVVAVLDSPVRTAAAIVHPRESMASSFVPAALALPSAKPKPPTALHSDRCSAAALAVALTREQTALAAAPAPAAAAAQQLQDLPEEALRRKAAAGLAAHASSGDASAGVSAAVSLEGRSDRLSSSDASCTGSGNSERIALIDFDMCLLLDRLDPPKPITNPFEVSVVGTREYMAPECYRGCYSTASDMWSIGVVLYVLIDGHFPFNLNRRAAAAAASPLASPTAASLPPEGAGLGAAGSAASGSPAGGSAAAAGFAVAVAGGGEGRQGCCLLAETRPVGGGVSNAEQKKGNTATARLIRNILRKGIRIDPSIQRKHPLAVDLLLRLLTYDPAKRLRHAYDALCHPWLQTIPWPVSLSQLRTSHSSSSSRNSVPVYFPAQGKPMGWGGRGGAAAAFTPCGVAAAPPPGVSCLYAACNSFQNVRVIPASPHKQHRGKNGSKPLVSGDGSHMRLCAGSAARKPAACCSRAALPAACCCKPPIIQSTLAGRTAAVSAVVAVKQASMRRRGFGRSACPLPLRHQQQIRNNKYGAIGFLRAAADTAAGTNPLIAKERAKAGQVADPNISPNHPHAPAATDAPAATGTPVASGAANATAVAACFPAPVLSRGPGIGGGLRCFHPFCLCSSSFCPGFPAAATPLPNGSSHLTPAAAVCPRWQEGGAAAVENTGKHVYLGGIEDQRRMNHVHQYSTSATSSVSSLGYGSCFGAAVPPGTEVFHFAGAYGWLAPRSAAAAAPRAGIGDSSQQDEARLKNQDTLQMSCLSSPPPHASVRHLQQQQLPRRPPVLLPPSPAKVVPLAVTAMEAKRHCFFPVSPNTAGTAAEKTSADAQRCSSAQATPQSRQNEQASSSKSHSEEGLRAADGACAQPPVASSVVAGPAMTEPRPQRQEQSWKQEQQHRWQAAEVPRYRRSRLLHKKSSTINQVCSPPSSPPPPVAEASSACVDGYGKSGEAFDLMPMPYRQKQTPAASTYRQTYTATASSADCLKHCLVVATDCLLQQVSSAIPPITGGAFDCTSSHSSADVVPANDLLLQHGCAAGVADLLPHGSPAAALEVFRQHRCTAPGGSELQLSFAAASPPLLHQGFARRDIEESLLRHAFADNPLHTMNSVRVPVCLQRRPPNPNYCAAADAAASSIPSTAEEERTEQLGLHHVHLGHIQQMCVQQELQQKQFARLDNTCCITTNPHTVGCFVPDSECVHQTP